MRKIFLIILLFLFAGCATKTKPEDLKITFSEPITNFAIFKLQPVKINPVHADKYEKIRQKMQSELEAKLMPALEKKSLSTAKMRRTLLIEPNIETIRVVHAGQRMIKGPFAGKSVIIVNVKFIDQKTKKLIAEKKFVDNSARWTGDIVNFNPDSKVLPRIITDITDSIEMNLLTQ